MTLNSWVGGDGNQSYGTTGADANWSLGHVPTSSEDAVINTGSNAATIGITSADPVENVDSIALGGNDILSINGGTLETQDGDPGNTNNGEIYLTGGGLLSLDGGNFDNGGSVKLNGTATAAQAAIWISGTVQLSGSGTIVMQIGDPGLANQITGNPGAPTTPTLINESEDISGTGTIGNGLNVINDAIIETNNGSSSSPGFLGIPGSQTGGSFINNGTVKTDNGGVLIFGDGQSSTINNDNIIELDATSKTTSLWIDGNVTIAPFINGNDIIDLTGSDPSQDTIISDGAAATLTLTNETLKGAGSVGDSNLTLINGSGAIIDADISGAILVLNTGGNTIENQATMEATNGGDLSIESFVDSSGTIQALGGVIDDSSLIEGSVSIGSGGTFIIESDSGVDGNVVFTGTGARLILDSSGGGISGSIGGGVSGDQIVLGSVAYASSIQATWQQTSSAGGTLSVMNGGATVYKLDLAGQYTNGYFSVQNDLGFVLINLPNPNPPAAATADMIMRDGSNGDYEIYDLGGNAIQTAAPLGQVGPEWQVAGLGGFNGSDTSDMILRASSNGALELYDISNNNITNAVALGQVGPEWAVAGFGDFSSNPGETDMLMRDSGTGKFEVYDISNNTITNAAPMGQVGLEWQVAGFGDFSSHAGETGDMLMRNSNTGQFEVYDIANNTIASAAPMGQVGLEWQVAGFGDFSGNPNETDMLMRDTNNGAFEYYDISNNTITGAGPMGQVGMEWQVSGFGPINGAGASDMLMRNTNTGAFEIYDISNNSITNATGMGQVGLEWSVGGIAVDPPTMGAAAAQLTQSMASFALAGSGLDAAPSPQPAPAEFATSAIVAAPTA